MKVPIVYKYISTIINIIVHLYFFRFLSPFISGEQTCSLFYRVSHDTWQFVNSFILYTGCPTIHDSLWIVFYSIYRVSHTIHDSLWIVFYSIYRVSHDTWQFVNSIILYTGCLTCFFNFIYRVSHDAWQFVNNFECLLLYQILILLIIHDIFFALKRFFNLKLRTFAF